MNVIEFFDDSGEIVVAKIPQEGSGEFTVGSQLVVQESQTAVFFRDGQALDAFTAGRHTLATRNLPFLTRLIGLDFGKSPFRAYVYFLALKTFTNLGWGTPTPVIFRDTDFRMVTLRAHGVYSIRIGKPRTFLLTMVGTKGLETTYALQEFLRQLIVAKFNQILGDNLKSILDLPVEYGNIAALVKEGVRAEFEQYGIELVDLMVEAITVPPEVQEMINRATGVAAQDVFKYQAIASADALRDAALNQGGAGAAMGTGLGLGMGLAMAQQMAGASAVLPHGAGAERGASEPASDVRGKLKELKAMLDEDLITQAEFDEKRKGILARL